MPKTPRGNTSSIVKTKHSQSTLPNKDEKLLQNIDKMKIDNMIFLAAGYH
jgi:hypothetical protein